MYVPTIHTRATNVELTDECKALIHNELAPIGQLLVAEENGHIDIVMRRLQHHLGGWRYCLSVKLTTTGGAYVAIAIEPTLKKALAKAQVLLRRSLSKGENVVRVPERRSATLRPGLLFREHFYPGLK